MEECAYDSAFMFKYSEREGTYASKHLEDDIPEEVKIRRLNEIIALQNRLSSEANARAVGKEYEVLVEGVSKRSRDQLSFQSVHVTSYLDVRNKTEWWFLIEVIIMWVSW